MIIAIDGPAGSGKSSTAKAVAARLGFRHLDSGAFYRAITFAALKTGIPVGTWSELSSRDLDALDIHTKPGEKGFDFYMGDRNITVEIRSSEVNEHVSPMAAVPAVRTWLMDKLHDAAESSDLVADGRDIGTVVFPDAEVKVFLIAQSETRARRRLAETGNAEPTYVDIQNEVDRLGRRDRMDSQRETAPLKQATDAVVIDTTSTSFDEQVERIVALARAASRKHRALD
jgi:cytidylate kinase